MEDRIKKILESDIFDHPEIKIQTFVHYFKKGDEDRATEQHKREILGAVLLGKEMSLNARDPNGGQIVCFEGIKGNKNFKIIRGKYYFSITMVAKNLWEIRSEAGFMYAPPEQDDSDWISVEDGDIKDGEYLCKIIGWDDMEYYRVLEYYSNSEEWDDWNGVAHKNITHYQEIKSP